MNHRAAARCGTVAAWALVLVMLRAGPACAQESRAGLISAQQQQKAGQLAPPERSRIEDTFSRVTRGFVETPEGFYPYFDSVYGGGGFTLGAGYRRYSGDNTLWDLKGLYSARNYKLFELSTISRDHWQGRATVGARAGWRDATRVGYWGLGMDTSDDDRADFRFQQTYVGADARIRPARLVVLDAALTYEDFDTKEGQGDRPSIEEAYAPGSAPGLGADPAFWHGRASAGIDWRPAEEYARHGGLYRLTYHNYADRRDTYSFDRLEAEVVQHVPILRETWVLSVRARLQTTLGDNDDVPYFLMPSLGSGSTLRGYRSWRFRDRHGLLLQGEWRWFPNRLFLDVAAFYDAGKVVSRRDQLDLDGLATDFGIGIRFHSPVATPLRVEIAHSDEVSWKLVFAGTAAF
jgi:hypothetical protein